MFPHVSRIFLIGLVLLVIFAPHFCFAQEEGASEGNDEKDNFDFSLGAVLTQGEKLAVRSAAKFTKKIPSLENFTENVNCDEDRAVYWQAAPSLDIKTGGEDSFDGIVAKLGARRYSMECGTIAELPALKWKEWMWLVPASIGFETDRRFNNLNLLAEIGIRPIDLLGYALCLPGKVSLNGFQRKNKEEIPFRMELGAYLQGGYKFDAGDNEPIEGGNVDDSSEDPDSALFRLKGHLGVFAKIIKFSWQPSDWGLDFLDCVIGKIDKKDQGIKLIASSTGWYDAVNDDVYHNIQGTLRITYSKGKNFDIKYENGSGAPNFNQGDQFSANLTMAF